MANVGKMKYMENLAKVVFANGAGLDIFHLASFFGFQPFSFQGRILGGWSQLVGGWDHPHV